MLTYDRWYLRSPNIQVTYTVLIDTAITPDEFEQALKLLTLRHPRLLCTVAVDADNRAWLIPDSAHLDIEYTDVLDFQELVKWHTAVDSHPWDFGRGLLHFRIACNGQHTRLAFHAHHLLTDGQGFNILIRDMLLALDNRIDSTPQPLPDIKLAYKPTFNVAQEMFGPALNNAWNKNPKSFSEQEFREFFVRYRNSHPPAEVFGDIKGNDFAQMINYCKTNQLTVNDFIVAAFMNATIDTFPQFYGDGKIRVSVVANIRNELLNPATACLGNYVSGIRMKMRWDSASDFRTNAAHIGQTLRKSLHHPQTRYFAWHFFSVFEPALIESVMYSAYDGWEHPISCQLSRLLGAVGDKGLGVSNIGCVNMGTFRRFKVCDMNFIPPAFPENRINVFVLTVGDTLHLCLRYVTTEVTAQQAASIMDKVLNFNMKNQA